LADWKIVARLKIAEFVITALFAAGVVANAQQVGVVEQFRSAPDRYAKVRVVSDALFGKQPATDIEVRDLLRTGMKDPDAFVRSETVGLTANIFVLSLMPAVPPEMSLALARRHVADALWTEFDAAADDPESRVRTEALRGISALLASDGPTPVLRSQLANRLVAKFETDPIAGVRSLSVSGLASSYLSEDPAVRKMGMQVLLQALADADPFIVQAAAHSAAKSTPPQALPLLVKQLKHSSLVARMAVGQVIAAYRDAARPYLPQLEAALAVETDDITRKTIAGTISVIAVR
jgi:hypothetical protein